MESINAAIIYLGRPYQDDLEEFHPDTTLPEWETVMDNIALARSVIEAGNVSGDWRPLVDRLADDVVLKTTVPDGTPISGEIRGKQAVVEHFTNLRDYLGFQQEKPIEYFGDGERVVVLGQESVEIKKTGVTVPGSEYVTVLDFRDGQITRFLVIQDMSEFTAAYRDGG